MAETGVMWKRRTNCSVGLRAFSSMFQSCITISIHVRKGGNEEPGELSPGLQWELSQNHCWRAAGLPDVFLSSVLISSILSMSFLSLKSTVPHPWYKTPESLVVQFLRAYEEWKQGPWRQSVRSFSFIFIHLFIRSFIHPSILALTECSLASFSGYDEYLHSLLTWLDSELPWKHSYEGVPREV